MWGGIGVFSLALRRGCDWWVWCVMMWSLTLLSSLWQRKPQLVTGMKIHFKKIKKSSTTTKVKQKPQASSHVRERHGKIPLKPCVQLSYSMSPFGRRMWLAGNWKFSSRSLARHNARCYRCKHSGSCCWRGSKLITYKLSCFAVILFKQIPWEAQTLPFFSLPSSFTPLMAGAATGRRGLFQQTGLSFSTSQLCFQQILEADILTQWDQKPTFTMWEVGGQS